jgi:diguanylate cyclase (GGDEF)-like protein
VYRLTDVMTASVSTCASLFRAAARLLTVATAFALGAAGHAGAPPDPPARLEAVEQHGRADPQSALNLLDTLLPGLQEPEARLAALRLQGTLLAALSQADAAERVAAELEALGARTDVRRAQAAAAYVRAKVLRNGGPLGRADRLLGQAVAQLPATTPAPVRLRYLALLADIKDATGQFDDAVRLFQEALALVDAGTPAWQRSELLSSLAYTLYQAGQVDRANAMNRQAREIAEAAGDHVALASAATTDAILATHAGDVVRELNALQAAIDHARRGGVRRAEVLGLANLSDYYLKRAQYDTALRRAQEALPLARAMSERSVESLALTNSGLALVSMKRKDEGMAAVRAALAIEERTGSVATMSITYSELGHYLEKAGYLEDALVAYRAHRKLADEVFQQDRQQAILELQEGFDHERRQRDLAQLNQDNRLKEEQLLGHELQQRLWAAGAAAGVLLLGVVALLHRRVRESNAALATSNEQLKRQSERDPLTGLSNRRHFQEAMRRVAADGRLEGTLFLMDLDHFKQINDVHGHAAGDAVLVEMAQRLRATLREQDLVVRWGGEEFLILVRGLAPEPVEQLAQRLLGTVAGSSVDTAAGPVDVSASIGFATFPLEPADYAPTWEEAIGLVDTALYLAKAHGRNRAYGVRLLNARSAAELAAVTRGLEAAWRDGTVALVLLQGPAPAGSAP